MFESEEAKWVYVEQLYELEKNKDLRMVPKLTEAHIFPTGFQKMRVKFATQIFSSTVASGISILNNSESISCIIKHCLNKHIF